MASASHKQKVQLYLYDLSQGMAKLLSAQFLGKQIDGIWHTGIVVFGHEYYYGGGIQAARPGCTMAGQPVQVIDLGETEVTQQVFHEWLHAVSPRFTPETYSLLTHNCNNFTSECSKFLTGKDIPSFITGLPEEALNTPLGMMLRPVISQMESQMKQSAGMAVPWQEQGGSSLNLPPLQTAHSASAAPSSPVPNGLSTAHRVAQDSQSSANPAATEERKAAESGHFHATLKLPALQSSSKPLLSSDQKAKSFETLIKTQSKKFGDKGASDAERTVLANAVAHLESSAPFSAQEVAETTKLFDRLIREWPASGQFPVLGIFRLLVLRDEIRAHYFSAYQTKQQDAVEVLLKFIHHQPTLSSAVEESKSEMPLSTQLMALCSLSNLFASADFGRLLAVHETVVDAALHVMTHKEQTMRALGAALLYNIGLFLPKDDSDVVVRVANALVHLSQTENDEETCYRLLCALGQVLYCNDSSVALIASLEYNAAGVAARFSSSRLKSIADDIAAIVASLEML